MRYPPHTPEDIAEMLQAVGVESLDGRFAGIPAACRNSPTPPMPPAARRNRRRPQAVPDGMMNDE